jgi:serine/threonine-protein kinase
MALTPGTRLGPYEVLAAIGQGGMGEVYRARDTKLGRDVALKILPEAFAYDPERLARFEREAQVLASLSHPNIGGIYGLEDSGGTKALVLEIIEGPTLADRIAEGPLPVEEALAMAGQIGEALEAAHNAGIIHRDLKPANIKLTSAGVVKVLDFGLAKAIETAPIGSSSLSLSPTITTPAMTQAGFILGTAAYMSPEQAKGKPVDKRADIWAFGVVLFEMLTGSRPFPGEDVSDVLASVLAREPQLAVIPDAVPLTVRHVLKACLQKDPKKRIHDMGDVRLAMSGAFETVRDAGTPVVTPRRSWSRVLATAAALILVAALTAGTVWILTPAESRPVTRFSHRLHDETFSRTGRPVVALSRDGRRLAYVADARIYLRNLDEPDAKPIPGTGENPSSPFFSPDGAWVGFWSSDEALKKIRLAGGTPVTLTKAGNPLGVSWGADDKIVYRVARRHLERVGERRCPRAPREDDTGRAHPRPADAAGRPGCAVRDDDCRRSPGLGRRPHRRAGARQRSSDGSARRRCRPSLRVNWAPCVCLGQHAVRDTVRSEGTGSAWGADTGCGRSPARSRSRHWHCPIRDLGQRCARPHQGPRG